MKITKITNTKTSVLTQCALGITGIQTNPDFFPMMEHARENGVIPNFTLTGIDLTDELAARTAQIAGAVAVSVYQTDKNIGYNTIHKLTTLGMNQVNIHLMVSKQTHQFAHEVIQDITNDPRLEKLNAIVFLGVKPKGRAKTNFTPLPFNDFAVMTAQCMEKGVNFGFDSCSAPKFEKFAQSLPNAKALLQVSESCESGLFSSYINQEGKFFPCSFCEGENEWVEDISVLEYDSFLDVWHHPRVKEWREKLLGATRNGCRPCLAFPVINEA